MRITLITFVIFQPAGFTIEINNTNATNVMVGLRVQIGTQSIERVPSYLEMFSRTVPVSIINNIY